MAVLTGHPTEISRVLAKWIKQIRYEDFPVEVVQEAKRAFLDWLGSALAGAGKEPGQISLTLVEELGGNPEATLLSNGKQTSCILAAFNNGVISHIVELDDVHKASILHAGAAIIPAALAAAEKVKADGRQLIEGIVAGYEVGIRIGEAVTPSHYYYWHNTGTVGTFGAAAAAGKILGLTEEELVHAIGSAGTQAAGLWEFLADGAMSKHLHPAKASMNGLLAALLAQRGFTAATKILEGEKGFCKAMASEFDLSKVTSGLGQGEGYKILENCYKIHSSCRHTHGGIDIALQLRKEYSLIPEQIKKIVVRTYPIAIDITGNFNPDSVYAAKFSLPYCVALALKEGKAGLREFNDLNLNDQAIRELISKVTLLEDAEIAALYPAKWPTTVEITDNHGNQYLGRTDYPQGDPENSVTDEQLKAKFRDLTTSLHSLEKVEILIASIFDLEHVKDLSGMLQRERSES
ncbi:MAG: MmgE/PrpD family protein [Desulfitobacterium hafniense]|nr:MmgE/PrpD family protein [Desulfitobacterium hafniense]